MKPVTLSTAPQSGITFDADWGFESADLVVAQIAINHAIGRALRKHGRPTKLPERGITTCAEELGEAAEHALDVARISDSRAKRVVLQTMCEELAQLAGYATLLIMSMKAEMRELEVVDGHEG